MAVDSTPGTQQVKSNASIYLAWIVPIAAFVASGLSLYDLSVRVVIAAESLRFGRYWNHVQLEVRCFEVVGFIVLTGFGLWRAIEITRLFRKVE